MPVETAFAALFILTLVVSMAWDVLKLEIPDTASVVLILGFVAGALWVGAGWQQIAAHASAALLVFVISTILFALNVWGGGDVKLATAMAFWFGWSGLAPWSFAVSLAGGVLALSILLLRKVPAGKSWPAWLHRLHQPHEGIPYGIALGAGGIVCLKQALIVFATVPA